MAKRSRLDAAACAAAVRRSKRQKAETLKKVEEAIASDGVLRLSNQIIFAKERPVTLRQAPYGQHPAYQRRGI